MRGATALAAVVFALVCCANAAADMPGTISYQAVLRDGSGTPVPDGTYDITFGIYLSPTSPLGIWAETQTLGVEGGIVNAHLGSVTSLASLDFQNPYWLGISVDGEPELTPRTPFETVPYAAHAGTADVALAGDDDWATHGNDIYRGLGDVGVGLPPVHARLDVVAGDGIAGDFSNGSLPDPAVRASNVGGTAGAFFSNAAPGAMPAFSAAVYGRGEVGARGGHFSAGAAEGLYAESEGTNTALLAEAHGTGHAAEFLGIGGIDVEYQAEVGGFRMTNGASTGYVLMSDPNGIGTWRPPATVSDGDWVVTYPDMYSGLPGNVGIGTMLPTAKLMIETTGEEEALYLKDLGSGRSTVKIVRETGTAVDHTLHLDILTAPDAYRFIRCERGGMDEFHVLGDGKVWASGGADFMDDVDVLGQLTADGAGIDGQLAVDYGGDRVAEFTTDSASADAHVVHVECTETEALTEGVAVYGKWEQSGEYGVGGQFYGGRIGVEGRAEDAGGIQIHTGVYGHATNANGNYGVSGEATGGVHTYGVYGTASGAAGSDHAGYFHGDVHVNGIFTSNNKFFKIDHPLDPANKYLQHSCVESDEMANVYSGNVTLDAGGKAMVLLPDWFEALNRDFRYQLTAIGAPGPGLYVAEEVSGNSFAIAGGEPGMKVSWQVTGIRQDASALEHRMEVELVKNPYDAGKYLNPELYGMPETAGVHYRGGR